MPTLKARIGGTWVPVGGGSTADEVWIGTNTPTDSTTELWYDTDEPNLYEPDTSRWNSAWGVVGRAVNTAGMTGIGATPTDVTGLTVTFTPVAGRQYRTVISWLAVTNVSGTVVPLITDGANTTFMQRNYTVQGGWYFLAAQISRALIAARSRPKHWHESRRAIRWRISGRQVMWKAPINISPRLRIWVRRQGFWSIY